MPTIGNRLTLGRFASRESADLFGTIELDMQLRLFTFLVGALLILIAGCGGGNDPVNEGKDKPVPAKDKK